MTVTDRINERRKVFKNTVGTDETRRRREDEAVQIRKKEKEEQLARRRRLVELGSDLTSVSTCLDDIAVTSASIPQLQEYLCSPDPLIVAEAAIAVRKILSVDRSPPIQQVLDAGLLPVLKSLLADGTRPNTQLEVCWALTNIASGTPAQTAAVVEAGIVPLFVELLRSPDKPLREQAVWAVANITGDRVEYRDGCIAVGTVGALVDIIENAIRTSCIQMLRLGVWAFSNLCRGKPGPDFSLLAPGVPVLGRVLSMSNDTEVLADACWALSYLTDTSGMKKSSIVEILRHIDLARVITFLSHPSSTVYTPVLRTVGNLVSGDSSITASVVNSNVLTFLKSLMLSKKKSIRKEALWAISNICADCPAHIQQVMDLGVMDRACEILRSGLADLDVRKEAAWCICNACTVGSAHQVHTLVTDSRFSVIRILCEFIETSQDTRTVLAVLDAIHAVLNTAGDNLQSFAGLVEECGGLNRIEDLQHDQSEDVYKASVRILENFFACNQDEDAVPSQFDFSKPRPTEPTNENLAPRH